MLDPTAVPPGVDGDRPWLRWSHFGLRTLYWSLWALWWTRVYEFATATVLPLLTPKVKQAALQEAASYGPTIAVIVSLGVVVGAVALARPPASKALIAREGRLARGLRISMIPLWGAWWTLSVALFAADRLDFQAPVLALVAQQFLFSFAATATLGYLSRLATALGQRVIAIVAALMAVYALMPLDFETVQYGLIGQPDWGPWLAVLSAGRLAATVVALGGGLIVCGRLRRLFAEMLAGRTTSAPQA